MKEEMVALLKLFGHLCRIQHVIRNTAAKLVVIYIIKNYVLIY